MVSIKLNFCKQQGFTLIEVLVASTIVIMSIGTLLQLFSAGLSQNHKVGQLAHLLSAQRTIIAKLGQINPAKQQSGEGIMQGLSYHWETKVTKPYKPIYLGSEDFPREIALHTFFIQIEKPTGNKYQFELQQVGWRDKK